MTSERLVLPGLPYQVPPPQNKMCLLEEQPEAVTEALRTIQKDMELSKAL